jgi:cytochrome c
MKEGKMNNFIKYLLVGAGIIVTILILSIANAADPVKGKKGFKKCVACHSLQEGKNKIGPSLYNLLDRKAGSV